jgi:hypothetical protein
LFRYINADASRGDFLARLKRIAAVREQGGAVPRDDEQAGAAAESGEIKDVRQMRDEQTVGASLGKSKPEPFDPAPV